MRAVERGGGDIEPVITHERIVHERHPAKHRHHHLIDANAKEDFMALVFRIPLSNTHSAKQTIHQLVTRVINQSVS